MDANERMLIRGSVTFRIFADSTVREKAHLPRGKVIHFHCEKTDLLLQVWSSSGNLMNY